MFNTLPNILIIGCRGNLGSLVLEQLHNSNFPIRCAKRLGESFVDPVIIPFKGFQNLQDFEPDIVINLANYYSQDTSPASIKKMHDSITGVAAAIATENIKWKAKIINISSYFQYCPEEFKPWSLYSELKSEALQILQKSSRSIKVGLVNLILYDNYGGRNKKKFFDLLIKSVAVKQSLDATFGEQVINLTDIANIATTIVQECSLGLNQHDNQVLTYDLKGIHTFKLRELAGLVSSVLDISPIIQWGAIPYRPKEVFTLWETTYKPPKYWSPKDQLSDYILKEAKVYNSSII